MAGIAIRIDRLQNVIVPIERFNGCFIDPRACGVL
jgi:hypothetical protein